MLFITNHFRTGSQSSQVKRPFIFDTKNNNIGMTFYCCEYSEDGKHSEIMSKNLFKRLAVSGCEQVLFYAHGFNTQPEAALARGHELQTLCDAVLPGKIAVVPLIWPNGDRAGVIRDYLSDQGQADASAFAFSRVLQAFARWSSDQEEICTMRLNVLAHSMGTRLLRGALQRWQKDFIGADVPMLFDHVFLAASDVVNETLSPGHPGEVMRHASSTVTVYHAARDLALRGSKAINLNNGMASRRLGHTGPMPFLAEFQNVVSVDCNDFAADYGDRNGHNYFGAASGGGPGMLFEHVLSTLSDGRVPGSATAHRFVLGQGGLIAVA